jgi:hypothetical protein
LFKNDFIEPGDFKTTRDWSGLSKEHISYLEETVLDTSSLIRRNKTLKLLIVLFVAFLFAPLFFNSAEPVAGRPQNKCDAGRTDPTHDPRLIERPNDDIKVIRLTNSGEFANRCELTNALYELDWDRPRPANSFGAHRKPNAVVLPKLVVLYVHGWKHNAEDDDADRQHFEKLIKSLRDQHEGRRYVVGIYIGWNAEAPLWGPLENITFWVKKNNADRIAQSATVTFIVSAIGSIVNSDPKRQDQFIAVGHSFGARVLFSATAQPIVQAVEQAHPGYPGGEYKRVVGIADAVVLLNPAFEASRYSTINGFIRNREHFSPSQAPLIVTISSTGDLATRWAFPLGQYLGLARTTRELHTLGNYAAFRTHQLKKGTCNSSPQDPITERFGAAGLCLDRLAVPPSDEIDTFDQKASAHNPFIVAQTTDDIIRDHNDIWNDTFRAWLTELITALQQLHTLDK